uniref:Uncharacterized protein n=1 Tax=Arundo donax TaxID=35708 RepID=A0A0A9AEL4_ARUDO
MGMRCSSRSSTRRMSPAAWPASASVSSMPCSSTPSVSSRTLASCARALLRVLTSFLRP